MYLKKLELSGFKSFAQQTILEFSSGITAIVGPNGSGKSNIADAVRWILGEQSMKSIRSQGSKDLIFSGSKTRSRLGKASVVICFDNSRGCIPLDYSEIVVSRTIFRDGTSEYFINKIPTKQMDVIEILAKANVGHRGFSVINQGMESEILKYSPSELYELLEEASGVRYLQLKKKRSERRLKTTQTNLEKVASILNELIPHLRYLKREATKAERREKLKKKLARLQKQFFFSQIVDLEEQKKDLSKEEKGLEAKISKLKKEIFQLNQEFQKKEEDIKESRKKFINAQKELERILDKRAKLGEQLADIRAQVEIEKAKQPIAKKRQINIDLARAREVFKHIQSALKKILKLEDLAKIKDETNQILSQIEKIIGDSELEDETEKIKAEKLDKLIVEQENLEKLLIKMNQAYEAQKAVLGINQDNLSQEKFFELERRLRKKKDNLSDLKSRDREIKWRIEQLESNFKELKQEITKAGMNYDNIRREKIEQISQPFEQAENEINRLKYRIEEIGGVDEITLQEYKETKERYERLNKKLEDLKKAKKNLEDLIRKLSKEIAVQFEKNFQVINNNFNKYFRLLFGGGKGHLKQITNYKSQITNIDEDQIDLDGKEQEIRKGIEIKATLPGKKIKNLRMFSGGEKALTSIALLFAIISSNPPPFLVLDEVDATLDESNARRFARLLREFSKDTQFIIITHNRETMDQADVLYGVTMGNDGISKLLSLRLEK